MKLLKTETHKDNLLGRSYKVNVYTIRLFSKTMKVSSNFIYGDKIPNWKESLNKVIASV